ncbi:MAG: transporter substrate-binding domain-containing protein [Lachnospiraceae bacterium]|nr:transporter substrate-binding domain-containing protein [Lachnospiraceae bacterium]
MADEKKSEGKGGFLGGLLEKIPIGGLIAGRPWIIFVAIGVVVLLLIIAIIAAVSGKKSGGQTTLVTPGMLTAAIVTGNDRFAHPGETGGLAGTEPELAAALAEAEGLSLKIVEASTVTEALSLLDTGAVDLAFGRISDTRNLKGYALSADYGRCGLFLVTAMHDYTDSLAMMTGYSVAVMDTVQTTAQSIRGYEFIAPKIYTDAVTLGTDVRDRAVNMGIVTERDAIALVKSFPEALQTQQVAGGPMENYVAVFPGRQAAHALVLNGVIASMEE